VVLPQDLVLIQTVQLMVKKKDLEIFSFLITMAYKRTYRKRGGYKKKAYRRKSYARKGRKTSPMKAMIRQELARAIETKNVQLYVPARQLFSSSNASWDLTNVVPVSGATSLPMQI
jgi:hypothetical protein